MGRCTYRFRVRAGYAAPAPRGPNGRCKGATRVAALLVFIEIDYLSLLEGAPLCHPLRHGMDLLRRSPTWASTFSFCFMFYVFCFLFCIDSFLPFLLFKNIQKFEIKIYKHFILDSKDFIM
jgi:hypothetical protein